MCVILKDQLRQMNDKYMDLSREYRAVLEDQQTQYEQKTIDFLNIHGNGSLGMQS